MTVQAWPGDVARYLFEERALTLTFADFFGLGYDAERDAITIPVEGCIKLRHLGGNGSKMTWLKSPNDGEPLPPYPSWGDLRTAELIVEGEFDAMVAIAPRASARRILMGEPCATSRTSPRAAKTVAESANSVGKDADVVGESENVVTDTPRESTGWKLARIGDPTSSRPSRGRSR